VRNHVDSKLAAFGNSAGRAILLRTFGSSVGRKVAGVFSNLDQASIDYFKGLPEAQLAIAVTDAAHIIARGVAPEHLTKIFAFPNLFGAGFTRANLLADFREIAAQRAQGIGSLVKFISDSNPFHSTFHGRVYEARALAHLVRESKADNVEIIQKLVKANPDGTGKQLTDIDFIGVDQVTGARAYFQTKISAAAFGSLNDVKKWVGKVTIDAARDNILTPVIRYVTPDPQAVPQDIRNYLLGIDPNIFSISAPLQ
jgi:hypothetical protein